MDYVVARMQAAGHTFDNATAMAAALPQTQPHSNRPPPVSQRTRGSALKDKLKVRERREALEQEVSELKQQLSNEQTVQQILERALQPSSERCSMALTNIPAFIPSKAKELLAELLLVEEEIARLEAQIHKMKQQQQQQQQQAPPQDASCNGGHRSPARPSATDHCKSMFFISQAMDSESYLSKMKKSTNPNPNKDDRRPPPAMNSSKNNNIILGGGGAGGGLPLLPRHSLDNNKQQPALPSSPFHHHQPPNIHHLHHEHELPIKTITKQSPTAKQREVQLQLQPPPNKLSERIVKCLVCIFIRLLRSSRVSEMTDKSSNLAKAVGSFSFRIDTGLVNVAAAKEKERGQQDHYGIFGIQDAIVRDIGPYKNLVRFTSSSLDLIRGFSASSLLSKLREMLEALQQVDLRSLNHQQKLAFWLNVYNTCIMHGILQHGLPSNSDKLLALKNKATINVSGKTFNALVIENFILRQPSSVKEEFWKCSADVEEQAVREVYGLRTSEPNILFALCCGIRSSPALRIYKADRVVMDLDKAKLEYLQASLVVTSTRRLMIPGLLHSNMHDFAKDMESLLRWVCEQLPTSWSLRKSMVDTLRSHPSYSTDMDGVVDAIPLDYDFQYLLPSM